MHTQKAVLHLSRPCVTSSNFVHDQNVKPNPHHVLDPQPMQVWMESMVWGSQCSTLRLPQTASPCCRQAVYTENDLNLGYTYSRS